MRKQHLRNGASPGRQRLRTHVRFEEKCWASLLLLCFVLLVFQETRLVFDHQHPPRIPGPMRPWKHSRARETRSKGHGSGDGLSGNLSPDLGSEHLIVSDDHAVSSVGADFVPAKQLNTFLDLLRRGQTANAHGDYVVLQLLDRSYLNMTRHWICNVRQWPSVLPSVVFVATDETAYDELKTFDSSLKVIFIPYLASDIDGDTSELEYGKVAYFKLLSFRSYLLYAALKNGIPFLLVESDSVWFQNALVSMENYLPTIGRFDMLSASDRYRRQRLQGGFMLNMATENSIALWRECFLIKVQRLESFLRTKMTIDEGSEQILLEKLISKYTNTSNYIHTFLPSAIVGSGIWYFKPKVRKNWPNPDVLLFNWAVGISAKVTRAIEHGHWCLDESGNRCRSSPATI